MEDRYEVGHCLGSGGMARVYLARDRLLDREVALKVLRQQYSEDAEFVERFRLEARNAASVPHPNIVQIYDWDQTPEGSYYIAMEYVAGGTLADRIERYGPLDPREAACVASQIANALGAAHDHGVIHRDVKPHNILLAESGEAKVTDFGIARASSAASISRRSAVLGTAAYMSPEQALGEGVGPQSDLYSLGVVLYEALTAEAPFSAETPTAVALKHVNELPRPPAEVDPEIPEGINAVATRLLCKELPNRYDSADALIQDLGLLERGGQPAAALASFAPAAAAGNFKRRLTRRSWRRRGRRLRAASVCLAVLLGAALLVWQGPEESGIAGFLGDTPLEEDAPGGISGQTPEPLESDAEPSGNASGAEEARAQEGVTATTAAAGGGSSGGGSASASASGDSSSGDRNLPDASGSGSTGSGLASGQTKAVSSETNGSGAAAQGGSVSAGSSRSALNSADQAGNGGEGSFSAGGAGGSFAAPPPAPPPDNSQTPPADWRQEPKPPTALSSPPPAPEPTTPATSPGLRQPNTPPEFATPVPAAPEPASPEQPTPPEPVASEPTIPQPEPVGPVRPEVQEPRSPERPTPEPPARPEIPNPQLPEPPTPEPPARPNVQKPGPPQQPNISEPESPKPAQPDLPEQPEISEPATPLEPEPTPPEPPAVG